MIKLLDYLNKYVYLPGLFIIWTYFAVASFLAGLVGAGLILVFIALVLASAIYYQFKPMNPVTTAEYLRIQIIMNQKMDEIRERYGLGGFL